MDILNETLLLTLWCHSIKFNNKINYKLILLNLLNLYLINIPFNKINEEIVGKMIEMENIKALERVYKIKKELITKKIGRAHV